MLSRPIIRGKIGKWSMALLEFNLRYVSQKSVKGQALADFLADHPCLEIEGEMDPIEISLIMLSPWKLNFDGSRTQDSTGVGIVIESPEGWKTQFSFQLSFDCSNNQAEYEALIIGLEILKEMGVSTVEIKGDSLLVLNQLAGKYNCNNISLALYCMIATQLMQDFDDVALQHVPRELNHEANEMAQVASRVYIPENLKEMVINIKRQTLPAR